MKKYLFLALGLTALLVACDKNEVPQPIVPADYTATYPVLDAETEYLGNWQIAPEWGDASLGVGPYKRTQIIDASKRFAFDCYSWPDWADNTKQLLGQGFSFSNRTGNGTDTENKNGYYANPKKGKNGSSYILVNANDFTRTMAGAVEDDAPYAEQITFLDPVTQDAVMYLPKSVYVTNVLNVVNSVKNGGMSPAMVEGDWYLLTIESVLDKTKKVEYYLADYRDGKTFVNEDWAQVDLTSIGATNGLKFTLTASKKQTNAFGLLITTYFCLDGLIVTEILKETNSDKAK